MKRFLFLFSAFQLFSFSAFSQVASVTVDANGNVTNGKAVNFATGKLKVNGVLIGNQNPPSFTLNFGGIGDNSTSNDAAFAAALASPFSTIYLSDGTYNTSLFANQVANKRFIGPGKINFQIGTGGPFPHPGNFTWLTTRPAVDSDPANPYTGDLTKIDAQKFVMDSGLRHSITEPYYEYSTTPHFQEFDLRGGSGGALAHLAAPSTAGQSTITVNTTTGITAPMQIGFNDGVGANAPTDIRTVASVNTGAHTVTFTAPLGLSHSNAVSITDSTRTSNPTHLELLTHRGGGDSYIWWGRVSAEGAAPAGITHIFENKTVGMIGGDLLASADNVYITPYEFQTSDAGHDIGVITVQSFNRTNNTGALGAVWIGNSLQSQGTVPMDVAYSASGLFNIGLDLQRANFGANACAIGLGSDQYVYFNNSFTPNAGQSLVGNVMGNSKMGYNSGVSALEFVIGGLRTHLEGSGWEQFFGANLGNTSGNTATSVTITQPIGSPTQNNSNMRWTAIRNSTGADFTTASHRLQNDVDGTKFGYIEFNPPGNIGGVAFGSNNTETIRAVPGAATITGTLAVSGLTASSFLETDGSKVLVSKTAGQMKTDLAIAFTDISGTSTKAQAPAADVYTDQANTFGAFLQKFQSGANFDLADPTDTTKLAQFDLSNIATATTRTVNIPNANSTTAQAKSSVSNQFLTAMSSQGVFSSAQPAIANLSDAGQLATYAAVTPATGITAWWASPTSANLAAAVTNETGSGALVFGTAPTIAGGSVTGLTSFGIRSSGTGAFDLTLANSENLTAGRTLTLALGDAARTLTLTGNPSIGGVTITGSGTLALGTKTLTLSNTLTLSGTDGTTMTFPTTSATLARTDAANSFTGHQTIEGVTSTGATGTGAFVFGTTPTLATPVINGTITGTGQATAATASTIAMRDSNANLTANNWLGGYTTTATAAGTTTLTVASTYVQFFTGSTTQTVTLPVASTLTLGHQFVIVNNSTGAVTVNSSGANAVIVLAGGSQAVLTCILTSGTTAASWNAAYSAGIVASGKKLTVNNTLTLAGTDATTMTFPATSATIARTDAANTFTGVQTFNTAIAVGSGGTGDTGTAWSSFTPTVTASVGTFTTASAAVNYKTIGKTVFINGSVTCTTIGSAAGRVIITMPVNPIGTVGGFSGLNGTTLNGVVGVTNFDFTNKISFTTPGGAFPFGGSGQTFYFSSVYESQ